MTEKINAFTYLIIPETIVLDVTIPVFAKILYGKIYSLSKNFGYCFASNKFLAGYFNMSVRYIIKCLRTLEEKNYIKIIFEKNANNENKRKIFINYEKIL